MNQQAIQGLEKAISNDYSNIVGMVVQKFGEKCYEGCFNGYTAGQATHVFSVTKSIFSALMGIAIEKGYIRDVNQKVLAFFPDYTVAEGESTIQNITLKHLLTMTAPYKYEIEPYAEFFASENWVNAALDLLGGEGQTGEFLYTGIIGIHILAGVLARATGQSLLAFANENLFDPLGIAVPHNVQLRDEQEHIAVMNDKNTTGWVVDPQGINTAGWGLFLSAADMAKIGQLYLDGGVCAAKQLVPASWIVQSTKVHSRWGALSYGYLWWVLDEKAGIYAAMGDGGNVIYINTQKQLVVAIASIDVPDAKDRIDFIMQQVEPLFRD